MEGVPIFPESSDDDDEETKSEKKSSKDGKELLKKSSFLEWLQTEKVSEKPANKPETKAEEPKIETEQAEAETPQTLDEAERTALTPIGELPAINVEVEDTSSLEQLDDTELSIVAEQLVDDHLEAVETELVNASENSPESDEAAIAAVFLEKVGSKLDSGEQPSAALFDAAAHETALENNLPADEISSDLTEEPIDAELEQPAEIIEEASEAFEPAADTEEEEPIPTLPIPPVTPPSSTTPPAGGTGGPPIPPIPPVTSPPPGSGAMPPVGGQPSLGPNLPPFTPNFNAAPNPNTFTQPNTATNYNQDPRRHSHLKYVLAGGLLGYLLGRRRGRIKTEERLLPVQEKLENQVTSLEQQLMERETALRRLAVRNRQEIETPNREQAVELVRRERQKRADKLRVYNINDHSLPKTLEQKPVIPQPESKAVYQVLEQRPQPAIKVEQLTAQQLLLEASKIEVGHFSLEQMYWQGKFTINEVREIVALYQAGQDYEHLLQRREASVHETLRHLNYDQPNKSPESQQGLPNQLVPLNPLQTQATANDVISSSSYIAPIRSAKTSGSTSKKELPAAAKAGIAAALVIVVVILAVVTSLWLLGAF